MSPPKELPETGLDSAVVPYLRREKESPGRLESGCNSICKRLRPMGFFAVMRLNSVSTVLPARQSTTFLLRFGRERADPDAAPKIG